MAMKFDDTAVNKLKNGNVLDLTPKQKAWLIEQVEIASQHGSLVLENADLINFKNTAQRYLSPKQLEEIQEEMDDVPETGY